MVLASADMPGFFTYSVIGEGKVMARRFLFLVPDSISTGLPADVVGAFERGREARSIVRF